MALNSLLCADVP